MRATKLNLLLVVVVILLAAIALYEPGIDVAEPPQKLLSLNADEINEITIRNGEQPILILKRDSDKNWQMVEPLQVEANQYKVESVLAILEQQPINRFEINTEKLTNYGLHKPQVELRLKGLNGEQRLMFGSQTPLNSYRYLQLNSEIVTCKDALMPRAQGCARVATIKDEAFYPVASLYTNFIVSRLLPEGVEMASIQLPDFRVAFGEGVWTLELQNSEEDSMESNPSADQLAQWLDGWRYASSIDIEAIDDRKIDDSQGEVVVTLRTGDKLRWSISVRDDGLVLGRPDLGIEYHMSDSQREALLMPPQPEPLQPSQEAAK